MPYHMFGLSHLSSHEHKPCMKKYANEFRDLEKCFQKNFFPKNETNYYLDTTLTFTSAKRKRNTIFKYIDDKCVLSTVKWSLISTQGNKVTTNTATHLQVFVEEKTKIPCEIKIRKTFREIYGPEQLIF